MCVTEHCRVTSLESSHPHWASSGPHPRAFPPGRLCFVPSGHKAPGEEGGALTRMLLANPWPRVWAHRALTQRGPHNVCRPRQREHVLLKLSGTRNSERDSTEEAEDPQVLYNTFSRPGLEPARGRSSSLARKQTVRGPGTGRAAAPTLASGLEGSGLTMLKGARISGQHSPKRAGQGRRVCTAGMRPTSKPLDNRRVG